LSDVPAHHPQWNKRNKFLLDELLACAKRTTIREN